MNIILHTVWLYKFQKQLMMNIMKYNELTKAFEGKIHENYGTCKSAVLSQNEVAIDSK